MKNLYRKIIGLSLLLIMVVVNLMGYTQSDVTATGTADDKYVKSVLNLKHELRFNSNGKFKILIFADIQDTFPLNAKLVSNMEKLLDKEKPDLVLLGGDNHSGYGDYVKNTSVMKTYFKAMSAPMEERRIPWAQVYGNHVLGGYGNDNVAVSKAEQQKILESFSYNISQAGTVSGTGNYVLPVLRSSGNKIAFNVFMLDSHSYVYKFRKGAEKLMLLETTTADYDNGKTKAKNMLYSGNTYDVIHMDQIKWYWDTSVALEQYNGSKIAAMMLFHIPLYEWNYVYMNQTATGYTGKKNDPISAPEANSGLFQACYERGDVKAMFCGHDHCNDFSGKYMGITMGYVPTIGAPIEDKSRPSGYYYYEDQIGARIVEIDENNAFAFTTRNSYVKDLK